MRYDAKSLFRDILTHNPSDYETEQELRSLIQQCIKAVEIRDEELVLRFGPKQEDCHDEDSY